MENSPAWEVFHGAVRGASRVLPRAYAWSMSHGAALAELDPAVEHLAEVCAGLAVLDPADTQVGAIDRIQQLERLKAVCAAAQARETAALEALRHAEEAARGVAKSRRGRGLGAEVGLARGESTARGTRGLRLAGALSTDLSHTMRALTAGTISEEHAHVVAKETSWLSSAHRKQADALIADRLGSLGPRRLAGEVRAHAQRLDQAGAVKRLAHAASERRVTTRPAPENMAYLTVFLPVQQAVAVEACLHRDATTMVGTGETAAPADPTGKPRTRDQIMADLLVERVTGQPTAPAVPAEVQVVMSDTALFGDDHTPAWLSGHGPIPARAAKQWLADPQMQVFLRRVFTRPKDHQLVGLESRARSFPPGLRRMIMLRDDMCRSPFCDRPAQHADHMDAAKDGGDTSYVNASGLCASCNQAKENIGWRHTGDPSQLTVTTPTGHTYSVDTPSILAGQPPDSAPPEVQETPADTDGPDPPEEPDDNPATTGSGPGC